MPTGSRLPSPGSPPPELRHSLGQPRHDAAEETPAPARASPPKTSLAPRRSWRLAGWTSTVSRRPSGSTSGWRPASGELLGAVNALGATLFGGFDRWAVKV